MVAIKETVLVFIVDRMSQPERMLLIEKKRGMGAGKWNAPGGKLNEGEDFLQAALRECVEESGLRPLDLEQRGILEFKFPPNAKSGSWDNHCHVFVATHYSGELVDENEECRAFWWPLHDLDYDKFWPDDRLWLPRLLDGQRFQYHFEFDDENRLIAHQKIM